MLYSHVGGISVVMYYILKTTRSHDHIGKASQRGILSACSIDRHTCSCLALLCWYLEPLSTAQATGLTLRVYADDVQRLKPFFIVTLTVKYTN